MVNFLKDKEDGDMSNLKPRPPITSESNSVSVVNCPEPSQSGVPTYGSMSYTVVNAALVTSQSAESERSKPLSATSIRVVNSVLRAKVNESAVRRDRDEDF